MFDLSFVELLFIAVAALVIIGPKDLPKVIAAGVGVFRQLKSAMNDIRAQVDELVDESGLKDTQQEIKTIIDEQGNVQEIYDISDFLDENGRYVSRSGAKDTPPRAGEPKENETPHDR